MNRFERCLLWMLTSICCLSGTAWASDPRLPGDTERSAELWATQDVIDSRLDEYAQYALMRMLSSDGVEALVASNILSAVKAGDLGGVYLPQQGVPARHARSLGKGYWQLLPAPSAEPRQDAVCVPGIEATAEKDAKPPLIVFRESVKRLPHVLDPALLSAWHGCQLSPYPPRGYRKTLPNKQPPVAPTAGEPPMGAVLAVMVMTGGEPRPDVVVGLAGPSTQGDTTDGGGLVFFRDLAEGRYTVTAQAPDGASAAATQEVTPASNVLLLELKTTAMPPGGSGGVVDRRGNGGVGGATSRGDGGGEGQPGSENQGRCIPQDGCRGAVVQDFAKRIATCRDNGLTCTKLCWISDGPKAFGKCLLSCTIKLQLCEMQAQRATGCCVEL